MTGDFNPGSYEVARKAAPLAEANAREAGLPRRNHVDAPRWADPGTVVRGIGLVLLGLLLGGWALTLLNGR